MQRISEWLARLRKPKEIDRRSEISKQSRKFYIKGIPAFFVFIVGLELLRNGNNKIFLCYENSVQNKMMVTVNNFFQKKIYVPTPYLYLGYFQRIYGKYLEREPYIRAEERVIDGDTLRIVELHDQTSKKPEVPIILMVAGSGGFDNAVKHLLNRFNSEGYRAISIEVKDFFNPDQLRKQVQKIKQKHPGAPIFGVGMQYGANLLINCAAKYPQMFEALVSIGNPFDLTRSQTNLKKESWKWLFLEDDMIQGRLRKQSKNLVPPKFLYDVDRLIYGLKEEEVEDFKRKNSCLDSIPKLTEPTLFFQSLEDPFTIKEYEDERLKNVNCFFAWTQRGGHNEWFHSIFADRWCPAMVLMYFKRLDFINKRLLALKQEVSLDSIANVDA